MEFTLSKKAILTQLVIVGEAKSINMSFFCHSKGEVRPTEDIDALNFAFFPFFPFQRNYLWYQHTVWNQRTHSQPERYIATH